MADLAFVSMRPKEDFVFQINENHKMAGVSLSSGGQKSSRSASMQATNLKFFTVLDGNFMILINEEAICYNKRW